MSDLHRKSIMLAWVAVAFSMVALTIALVSGCATLYKPVVDYALSQVEENISDKVDKIIREVAAKPVPPLPPMGSSWTEYGVWGGTVAMGSLAVLVDRRRYHSKRAAGLSEVGVRTG